MPPVQSEEGIVQAVAGIRRLREHIRVPFAFETGVSHLWPGNCPRGRSSPPSPGAPTAGSGSACTPSGRTSATDAGPIAPELMDLARQVIPGLPNLKAVVHEVMPGRAPEGAIMRDQREESRGSGAVDGLLAALREGLLPTGLGPGTYEVMMTPPV